MQNIEELTKRLKATERFADETSRIIDKLCSWQLDSVCLQKIPTKEEILLEFQNFTKLSLQAKKDGITDSYLVYKLGRNVIEAFKMFQDTVPEFKSLQ